MKFSQIDTKKITKTLKGLNPARGGKILVSAMTKVGIDLEGALRLNTASSGGSFKRPSGQLARSIQSKLVVRGTTISSVVGSGVRTGDRLPYANIQEKGGTIRAKNSKWLTIPLSGAKTASGRAKKASARDFSDTFVDKSESGNLIIFQEKGDKIIPLFLLRKSVKVPGTKYMSRTLSSHTVRIGKILVDTVNREAFK